MTKYESHNASLCSQLVLLCVQLDPSVDRHHLEMYLSAEEFRSVFNMSKREFQLLPIWKQVTLKWDTDLYENDK